jgi:hypothetical protein
MAVIEAAFRLFDRHPRWFVVALIIHTMIMAGLLTVLVS